MARGKDAKLRRRQNRSKDKEEGEEGGIFDGDEQTTEDDNNGANDIPLPPSMQKKKAKGSQAPVEDDSDDDDDEGEDHNMPVRKKKKKKKVPVAVAGGGGGGGLGGFLGGLKTGPLILLVMLTGTTVLPALIFASDYVGKFMGQHNVLGNLGFRLGIGAVPKKRVISFYEKHSPEKLGEVPHILSKYYGDYPDLIKKLERKYGDYGYFIGWKDDEAPLVFVKESLQSMYDAWIARYWNKYAPQQLKTAFRNVKYNLTALQKKFKKVWRRHIWPAIEPIFGVPKGAEKQKRQDSADARKKMYKEKGTRRKNTDFRDDDDEN